MARLVNDQHLDICHQVPNNKHNEWIDQNSDWFNNLKQLSTHDSMHCVIKFHIWKIWQ